MIKKTLELETCIDIFNTWSNILLILSNYKISEYFLNQSVLKFFCIYAYLLILFSFRYVRHFNNKLAKFCMFIVIEPERLEYVIFKYNNTLCTHFLIHNKNQRGKTINTVRIRWISCNVINNVYSFILMKDIFNIHDIIIVMIF